MLILLGLAAFGTAVLSATFGMAGGLVLMGVYTAVLPVEVAMVLHGATQLLANGVRAGVWWRHVDWIGVALYAVGAIAAWVVFRVVAYVPDATTVYLLLGLVPFVARLVPKLRWLDFRWRPAALLAGLLVCGLQMVAGVAGPVLDVFFLGEGLERHNVVGTKAATQTLSHLAKITYFAAFLAPGALDLPTVGVVLVCAILGTLAGSRLLERWTDTSFRSATRTVVLVVGGVYLLIGLVRWVSGAER